MQSESKHSLGVLVLRKITVPLKVKEIKTGCFSNCESLSSVKLPLNLTSISSDAFAGCISLTSLVVGALVKDLHQLFQSVTTIRVAEGTTDIPAGVFANMPSLKDITVCSSVQTIEDGAFSGCTGIKTFTYEGYAKIENDIGIPESTTIHVNQDYQYSRIGGILISGRTDPSHSSSSKLSGGAIAGISIGCVVVVAAIIGCVIFFMHKSSSESDSEDKTVNL